MLIDRLQIVTNTEIAPGIYSMTIHMPEAAKNAHPGQFVMVYTGKGELLLPRPISICDADGEVLRLVYQVVGKGTEAMAQMQHGGYVKILAPLGKGFFLSPEAARTPLKSVALVGGGIGTPPLLLLAKKLKAQGAYVDVYLGFRANPILTAEFKAIADNLHIATEDGSVGHKGNILEVLQQKSQPYDEILACGPRPMLGALANYAQSKGILCQVSMEERMACGLGTCVGCVLEISGTYLRICTEGPVFYSDKINW